MKETNRGDRVRIGIIGPSDLVAWVCSEVPMRFIDTPSFQLFPGIYADEREAIERVAELDSLVDGFLFTGPLPFHLVEQEYAGSKSMSYVPLSGASLFAALVRASFASLDEATWVSVDSMDKSSVSDSYKDLGLVTSQGPLVAPAELRNDPDGLVEFHTNAIDTEKAGIVFTGVRSVYDRLVGDGIPAMRVTPVMASVRTALRTSVLLTKGDLGKELHTVCLLVSIADVSPLLAPPEDAYDAHLRVLIALANWARRINGLRFDLGGGSALVIWSDDARRPSRVDEIELAALKERLNNEAGQEVVLSAGRGLTVQDAYVGAVHDSSRVRSQVVETAPNLNGSSDHDEQVVSTYTELLRRVNHVSANAHEKNGVFSADTAGEVLGLSERQARRQMDALVSAGLAWILPSSAEGKPGRPRRRWRLLHGESDRDSNDWSPMP